MSVLAVLTLAAGSRQAIDSWDELERRQVIVSAIDIVVQDVFDLSRPSENHLIGRLSNAVHIETHGEVVRRELLFVAGQPVNARAIRETERNLRRYPFVRDARIIPVGASETSVTARVEVFDAWSLQGRIGLSLTGGNTEWSVRVDEVNLLGRGKRLYVEHEQDIERSATGFGYTDPQLFGSRWVGAFGYSDLSDGSTRFLLVDHPYFSVLTPYAAGGTAGTSERLLTQYNYGEADTVVPVRSTVSSAGASRAVWRAERSALRIGGSYRAEEHSYGSVVTSGGALPPPDTSLRRVRGVAGTVSLVQERLVSFQDFRRIGRTEDYNAGWTMTGAAGYHARAFGSLANAPFGDVSIQKGWTPGAERLVLFDVYIRGRHENQEWRDAVSRASVTTYVRGTHGQTFAAQLSAASSTNPDLDDWLYLGGRDGLRGYVDHFLAGDRRVTFSLEDRIITPWRPFGIVQAGFVAYFDAGAIRRADTGRWSRLYANVGGGLRFGLSKSGGSLIHISIATPLVREAGTDGLLLVLGNAVTF